jgi:hypothetical protein
VILRKKFRKPEKKKKFIKELSGRLNLIQEDSYNKLPIEYEENEDIKMFIMEQFKPKIQKEQNKQWTMSCTKLMR